MHAGVHAAHPSPLLRHHADSFACAMPMDSYDGEPSGENAVTAIFSCAHQRSIRGCARYGCSSIWCTAGRIAHAFLFTGPRGVGKTTTAINLAAALAKSGQQPEMDGAQKILKLQPENEDALQRLTEGYLAQQKLSEAARSAAELLAVVSAKTRPERYSEAAWRDKKTVLTNRAHFIAGASGYLPMQFLSSNSNQRSDAYGGNAESRVRFVVETLSAIAAAIGSGRVGFRICPGVTFNGMADAVQARIDDGQIHALALKTRAPEAT
mgnify:CR=1 FL=1